MFKEASVEILNIFNTISLEFLKNKQSWLPFFILNFMTVLPYAHFCELE